MTHNSVACNHPLNLWGQGSLSDVEDGGSGSHYTAGALTGPGSHGQSLHAVGDVGHRLVLPDGR